MAEHNGELQKEDSDKEIVVLKEESRRLREERIRLQTQVEDDMKVNAELQEQLLQLTKHVKVNHNSNFAFLFFLTFFLPFYKEQVQMAVLLQCFQCIYSKPKPNIDYWEWNLQK